MAITGYIEVLSNQQVRGWAFAPERPDEHIFIVVSVASNIIATVKANLFREDLQQANVGAGDHAFVVNFPNMLDDVEVELVRVQCVSHDLGKLNLVVSDAPVQPQPAKPQPLPPIHFAVDVLAQQKPLFILGAARSGTSALAQCLVKTGFYEGYEEGFVFDLAARLLHTVQTYYDDHGEETTRNTLLARVPMRFLNEAIKDQFRAIARFAFRGERWLDKTPSQQMVDAAPLLAEIWPNAKFVFMKRRALENIDSRLRKFADALPFSAYCEDWRATMQAWRQVRDRLGTRAIEVEQLEMASNSSGIVQALKELLELPDAAASRLEVLLNMEQPERTAGRFADVLDIDSLSWPLEHKALFRQICLDEMKIFGYSINKAYYAE